MAATYWCTVVDVAVAESAICGTGISVLMGAFFIWSAHSEKCNFAVDNC